MSTKIERLIASLILASAGCLLFHWWGESRLSTSERGALDAHNDLANGHYEMKISGKLAYPDSSYWKYVSLLHERYGVRVNWVGGCWVSQELSEYMQAYNAVAKKGIHARFRKDVFAECERDARDDG